MHNNGGQEKVQDFITDVTVELQLVEIVKKAYTL